jgi:purine-binding chemotaxis protein CheW
MTKRKITKGQSRSPGAIALDKPDFLQALSFAEATPQTSALPDNAPHHAETVQPLAQLQTGSENQSIQSAAALMPRDDAARRVLEERARVFAMPVGEHQHELHNQYLRFRLGMVERYGIPYQYLEELLYVGNLARVPCTPSFVAGVVNHRGELLTIVNLKQFFRMPALAVGDEARIIVVRCNEMRIGLLVDEVDGNEEYLDSEISSPLSSEGVSNMEYVLGIHAGNVTILNIASLLGDPALRVNR